MMTTRTDLPMGCDAEQTWEPLIQMTRRNKSQSARYLAIVERRPFSEMRVTPEGRMSVPNTSKGSF